MADLKIPNLYKNSDKFLFKKKLSLRRKSKGKLIKESFVLLLLSVFLIFLFNIIPNKLSVFNNFQNNIIIFLTTISKSISYLYEICLVLFIIVIVIFNLFLLLGVFSRVKKILKRKSRQISVK